jgi:TfoX/Sxy family transcriptional regulator of competence genes
MMDDELTLRVRAALKGRRAVSEKRMFGGVCFLLRGNMLCGTSKGRLMVRVGAEQHVAALARRGARPMNFTGKAMKGFVWVNEKGYAGAGLRRWIVMAERYVGKLPAKKSG